MNKYRKKTKYNSSDVYFCSFDLPIFVSSYDSVFPPFEAKDI